MSVKRQWRVMKLRQLSMDESVRAQLIKDIISRKHPTIQLYAWKVRHKGVNLIAEQAFFNRQEAIKDWYMAKRVWENEEPPSGVVIYAWKMCVDDIIKHADGTTLREMKLPRQREMDVVIPPSSIQEDIQRTLQNQS